MFASGQLAELSCGCRDITAQKRNARRLIKSTYVPWKLRRAVHGRDLKSSEPCAGG